eukprot:464664-Rhodomonas_salina.2
MDKIRATLLDGVVRLAICLRHPQYCLAVCCYARGTAVTRCPVLNPTMSLRTQYRMTVPPLGMLLRAQYKMRSTDAAGGGTTS